MRNQIAAAERLGLRADTINSSNRDEWNAVQGRVKRGEVDVLLISPERLANDEFRAGVLSLIARNVRILVVDEAHYYQQVGRAGRALPDAYGILLGGHEDDEIADYFIRTAFSPEAHCIEVLAALNAADEGLSSRELKRTVNLSARQIERVLKSLAVKSPAPIDKQDRRWYATDVHYE